jgi:hypothetical protein
LIRGTASNLTASLFWSSAQARNGILARYIDPAGHKRLVREYMCTALLLLINNLSFSIK